MKIFDVFAQKINSLFRRLKGKNKLSFEFLGNIIFQRVVILLFLSVGLTLLLAPNFYESSPKYKHGMIAQDNIKADRDFLVEDANSTRQKRTEAADNVRSVFDFDAEISITLYNKLVRATTELNASSSKEQFEKLLGISLSDQELYFLKNTIYTNEGLAKISRILTAFYEKNLITGHAFSKQDREKGITLINLNTRVEENFKDISFIKNIKNIDTALKQSVNAVISAGQPNNRRHTFSFLKELIVPNLVFNAEATQLRRATALEEVKPVYFQVQKNEMIVREGDKIGHLELAKLDAFYKSLTNDKVSAAAMILGIFLTTLFLSLLLYFWRTRNWFRSAPRSNADFLVFAIVAIVQIILIKAGIFIGVAVNRAFPAVPVEACYFAIPFACGAMIMAVLVNRNMALIMSVLISFLISPLFEGKMLIPLFAFLGSIAASYHIVSSRQRSAFLKVGVFLGIINMASILCLNLLYGNLLNDLPLRLAMGLAGGLITGILVAGITPIFESLFGFITYIKLLELANLNQPLFQRMIIEAPGTYHHSIIVASLVEAAAEAIGANALLSKVSAYYHDIGKLSKPQYFIENQPGFDNRHDKLSPKMSSLVIISHVKEGCELALEAKLGQPIINIIREHHGTSLVSYFFDKAKKNKDESLRALTESDFRYPGPKPQTREAGLVMLGDVIEASSRTLTNPTPARIRSLVRERIERVYMDGQLDDCELTLKDLNIIAETFTRILTGIFHHRIDYPEAPQKETNGKKDFNDNSNRKSAEAG